MIITVTGPSGCGKTTAVKGLLRRLGNDACEFVSHTTRKPRSGENDGKDYYFVSRDKFWLTDYVETVEFNGNFYGLSQTEIRSKVDQYRWCFVILNPEGKDNLREFVNTEIPGCSIRSIYIKIDPEMAFGNLKHRDGVRKAKTRQAYDIAAGMYVSAGYDCIISNDSTKRDLIDNLHNYIVAMQFESSLNRRGS